MINRRSFFGVLGALVPTQSHATEYCSNPPNVDVGAPIVGAPIVGGTVPFTGHGNWCVISQGPYTFRLNPASEPVVITLRGDRA